MKRDAPHGNEWSKRPRHDGGNWSSQHGTWWGTTGGWQYTEQFANWRQVRPLAHPPRPPRPFVRPSGTASFAQHENEEPRHGAELRPIPIKQPLIQPFQRATSSDARAPVRAPPPRDIKQGTPVTPSADKERDDIGVTPRAKAGDDAANFEPKAKAAKKEPKAKVAKKEPKAKVSKEPKAKAVKKEPKAKAPKVPKVPKVPKAPKAKAVKKESTAKAKLKAKAKAVAADGPATADDVEAKWEDDVGWAADGAEEDKGTVSIELPPEVYAEKEAGWEGPAILKRCPELRDVARVRGAVKLFGEGNTLPFIARYRKHVTGNMTEDELRVVEKHLASVHHLETRRKNILKQCLKNEVTLPDLAPIQAATSLEELEEAYAPFKEAKGPTPVQAAIERGCKPLADAIVQDDAHEIARLSQCVDLEGGILVASDHLWQESDKTQMRKTLQFRAEIKVQKKTDDETYRHYWGFSAQLRSVKAHQWLAIQRGEREKALKVSFEANDAPLFLTARTVELGKAQGLMRKRLVKVVEREWRRELKDSAEEEAFLSYRRNVKQKLLTPPWHVWGEVGPLVALDPGYRQGVKIAAIDARGSVLLCETIYLHQSDVARKLKQICDTVDPKLISIGNGTGSRETEALVTQVTQVPYVITDECGASIYSASKVGTSDLPDVDVTHRSAVSIARRVLDPLSEFVKIDPQSLGVGMYQHDVDATRLTKELRDSVESCVASVGVDLNSASLQLLQYLPGVGPKMAQKIIDQRQEQAFARKKDLLKVKGLGPKLFTQAAGFACISGLEPGSLDAISHIHPESYATAEKLQMTFGKKLENMTGTDVSALHLDAPIEVINDIISQLKDPGDARKNMPCPELRSGLDDRPRKPEDLKPGMVVSGTVRNVVTFGAFVDVGVGHDALLHVKETRGRTLAINEVLKVRVLAMERRESKIRISLGLTG